MFRVVWDPSWGSIELYLSEIRSGSLMFVVCLVGVWQRNFEPVVCVCVCVYGTTAGDSPSYRTHTHRRFKITHDWCSQVFCREGRCSGGNCPNIRQPSQVRRADPQMSVCAFCPFVGFFSLSRGVAGGRGEARFAGVPDGAVGAVQGAESFSF